MPLMQFSRAVLPAPFGPISAATLPSSASMLTFRRTRSPPKLSERSSISRMRIMSVPAPDPAILLHVAVASIALALLAEVELFDIAVLQQPIGRAGEHHAPILQDVAVMRDAEHTPDVLINNQHGQSELAIEL